MKALLLDLGGVVATNAPRLFIREFAVKHNLTLEEVVEAFRANFGKWLLGEISEEEHWKRFLNEVNLPIPEDEFVKECSEMLRLFALVNDDVIELIEQVKAEANKEETTLKIVIVSNCPKELAHYLKEAYALSETFDAMYFSGEQGMSKPDKELFEKAAKELDVKLEDCTFVDDRERNTKPAAELGMQTILFTDTTSLQEVKEEHQNEKN